MDEVKSSVKGKDILNDPLLNRGTIFSNKERDQLGLHGLLPCHVSTVEEQLERHYALFSHLTDPIQKHQFLSSLQNTNEILFYMLAEKHITEMMPFIYTPTVGDISVQFSKLFQFHRGLYVSYPLRHKMQEIIDNIPERELQVIVVTDGERILGLGDLGMGGIAISIGKLALYTLFGGIHPSKALPVVLDVGTDNESLRAHPLYLGWKSPRLRGQEYDDFVDSFVMAIKKRYPTILLQWEDFGKANASRLLEKYRDKICSFNDDIQGTAAVTLAAIFSALTIKKESLSEQRFVILGGGSAGIGICKKILFALTKEGLSEKEAKRCFFIVDIHGLIHDGLDDIDEAQRQFAYPYSEVKGWAKKGSNKIALLEVVKKAKPTVLIGVSAQRGAFSEEIIKEMAKHTTIPIILPLSNPNDRCEAMPEDVLRWTSGNVIIATGSPFPKVSFQKKIYPIAQCNNVYIFPGVGLGVIASGISKITDSLFLAASKALAGCSPMRCDLAAPLFPLFEELKEVSLKIAFSVYKEAVREGLAENISNEEIKKRIDKACWKIGYSEVFSG
jgi:malate dehydrogenase (oxaloacetate-decarboxylating)